MKIFMQIRVLQIYDFIFQLMNKSIILHASHQDAQRMRGYTAQAHIECATRTRMQYSVIIINRPIKNKINADITF